jgi:ABC-type sugar transport system ATPase subunit
MHALEATGIRKTYGGIVALDDASLVVRPGTVHALLGENGAGKSTLVKIMTGAVVPDAGSLRLDGAEVQFANTADAVRHGVAVVSQELSLFPHLDVLSNLYPMREPMRGPLVDRRAMRERAQPILAELGLAIDPRTMIRDLTLAERQLVEIAKALVTSPRVLLLDEPTSALESGATERLLGVLRVLRQREVAVVYVSHILEEVMSLCDEVTVLRDGRGVMAAEPMAGLTMQSIVHSMLGERPPAPEPARRDGTSPALEGSGLELEHVSIRGSLDDVSLTVERGEIMGLASLAGSGSLSVLRAVAGIRPPGSGTVRLPGGRPAPRTFRQAVASGVAFVSGDRRRLGLMLDKPVWENIVMVRTMGMARDGLFLRPDALRTRARELMRRLAIKAPSANARASQLSGGNQQKVVLAKWLDMSPSILLLDDPTRGVDIGARAEIHALLRSAADAGAVVMLRSTDLEELASICDRVVVLYRGRICAELTGTARSARAILHLMNTGEPLAADGGASSAVALDLAGPRPAGAV